MYARRLGKALLLSDAPTEGSKQAVQTPPPTTKPDQTSVFHWVEQGDSYIQRWEIVDTGASEPSYGEDPTPEDYEAALNLMGVDT